MTLTLYSATVPVFIRMLGNLDAWLGQAEAHAQAKKFDPTIFLATRLAPDMLPFSKQVQIAGDTAKFCVARVAAIESPSFPDTEATLGELRERVAKTIGFVGSVTAEQFAGGDEREVTMPRRDGTLTLTGLAYVERFALPNFYFHAGMTYALLRHNGVPLGKMDFLGALKD